MRIGQMDRRIVIQVVTEGRSASGQITETWATLATVWAYVKYDRGFEGTQGDAEQARADRIFGIRYRSDVTAKSRISYQDEIYDILSIAELGRREGLEIKAVAKVL